MTRREAGHPDTTPAPTDADLARLDADLHRLYAAPLPPRHDHAIARALRENARRQARHALPAWLRRSAALAVSTLLAVVVLAGAYAATSLVDQLLPRFILQHSEKLNLSRSACGFTITIQRAYLDGNEVVVGFTLQGPPGRTFIPALADLDARLTTAPPGTQPLPLPLQTPLLAVAGPVEGSAQGQVLAFDASNIVGQSRLLSLRLTVPAIAMTEQVGRNAPAAQRCEAYYPSNVPPQWRGTKKPVRLVVVKGPFTFDFKVPRYSKQRTLAPRLEAVAAGERVVLERVVVTPTSTRLYLRRAGGEDGKTMRRPDLTLTDLAIARQGRPSAVGGARFQADPFWIQTSHGIVPYADNVPNSAGVVEYDVLGPSLYNYHGPWVLRVPTRTGSVTFHFAVP